jgi:hypothetical protein
MPFFEQLQYLQTQKSGLLCQIRFCVLLHQLHEYLCASITSFALHDRCHTFNNQSHKKTYNRIALPGPSRTFRTCHALPPEHGTKRHSWTS